MDQKEFTRKELYDLVWTKPLTTLSKEFNLSDNGLRKICIKYEIPLPIGGHWQKIQYGKKISQTPYKYEEKWKDVKIKISDKGEIEKEHVLSQIARISKEIEKAYPELLIVPENLLKPDPMIQAAKADLKTQKSTNWRGNKICLSTSSGLFSISVAKENVSRALIFMNSFIKLSRKRGHQIEINGHETIFIVDEERYRIRFREKNTRISFKDGSYMSSDLVPNGILSLKFDDLYDKEWKDGSVPLEKQLAKIIASFEIKAKEDKIQRAEREAYWAECDRLEIIRKKEQARLAWENNKIEILLKHSSQWNQSQQLLNFIKEVEAKNVGFENKEKIDNWIDWAKKEVMKLDPISDGILEFVSKYDYNLD